MATTATGFRRRRRLLATRTRNSRGYECNRKVISDSCLDGNTIVIRENGMAKYYIAFTDNLGSILAVVDEDGRRVFNASYDAWGRQTVTHNTIGLHRGYTGHEMLAEYDIINMNGRLYDPVLGRFFSPDNYVQMPDNSQSFNRYSYFGATWHGVETCMRGQQG